MNYPIKDVNYIHDLSNERSPIVVKSGCRSVGDITTTTGGFKFTPRNDYGPVIGTFYDVSSAKEYLEKGGDLGPLTRKKNNK